MSKSNKRRRSRARSSALPKGAYRLPTGGYVTKSKSVIVGSGGKTRRLSIQAVRRDQVDVQLLAKTFLALAREQAEDERRNRKSD